MKALFHRFNRGLSKDKDRDPQKDRELHKEKLPQLPPLPEWPPQRATSTPTSITSSKPLPDISTRPLPPINEPQRSLSSQSSSTQTPPRVSAPSIRADDDSASLSVLSQHDQDSAGHSSRKTTNGSISTTQTPPLNGDSQKKVAFMSPPPTPAAPLIDRTISETPSTASAASPPLKTSVSRFQATHGKDPRGSTSTATSTLKADAVSIEKATTSSVKATSTRTATSPYPQKNMADAASLHQSLRSGTPYSQMSNTSSRILAVSSWSEGAEEDLVSNLGPRERTRQEVLWEIVASEERYVAELVKLKDTFIEPLLHPFSSVSSPTPSSPLVDYDDFSRADSPRESVEQLPIAARFMSPTGFRSDTPHASESTTTNRNDKDKDTPNIDGESLETDEDDDQMGKDFPRSQASKFNHPRSPYRATATRTATGGKNAVAFPSRSHQSLPPPPRNNQLSASTQSLGRQSVIFESERERNHSSGQASGSDRKTTATQGSRMLRKFRKSQTSRPETLWGGAVPPHQLPEDLRICLEVIESGILDGHIRLSEGLRKRYEEQYPLVRSLADVFVSNSLIFQGYATYVLHLERALEQVDNALSTASATKKPKNQDSVEWLKVCKYLQKLEEIASDKGETGLAISLSKPFQRLLKYPLLFQNLLFHTDPSTFEYESTLQMVSEVENIVRSIEDEKIQKEERDKTRDVFARIEGLDKVKQLALPKPSRVLVEERLLIGIQENGLPKQTSSPPPAMSSKGVKGKTSFKRLSDVLQSGSGVGGKKDLWLVVFNDVALRCQRTGTTSLPLVAATNSRTNSLPELQGKAKYATTGRRSSHTKPRNLYKFIKIESWAIGDVVQPRVGVVSMEDVVRSKNQHYSVIQPRIVPLPADDEDNGAESDDSDRKSKMSFSYWGADKVTIQKPAIKPRQVGALGVPRRSSPGNSSYGRESSANAKFGTRLVSGDHPSPSGARPHSRRTQTATPGGRRLPAASDDSQSAKATVTRPAWDTSTRAVPAISTNPAPQKRVRNVSQTSAATNRATTTTNTKQLASPAPSEDSGVGFYRQIMAKDPSLTRE